MKHGNKLFGTDGIRGTPGVYPLTDGMMYKIGKSMARMVLTRHTAAPRNRVVIGRDTRTSGSQMETILSNALTSAGIDVVLTGIMTTPGLSYITHVLGGCLGVMISASHNKASENGIKFFDSRGYKLSDDDESWLEELIFDAFVTSNDGPNVDTAGTVQVFQEAKDCYADFLVSTMEGTRLEGMHIVLDCAWGAGSFIAERVFQRVGARVSVIHDSLSGENINVGGATNPYQLRELVLTTQANAGLALDGDADRGIFVDETGAIADGDSLLCVAAEFLMRTGKLRGNTLAATVMSNVGVKKFLESIGGHVIYTKIGDKYVLDAIVKHDLSLGGEQSGRIVFRDYLPAADGILTGLQMCKIMYETKKPLSALVGAVEKVPQVLVNVRVREKRPFDLLPSVSEKLAYYNEQLKNHGRILLRYSGTEALARVMVEGVDRQLIENIAFSLAGQINQEIGQQE